MIRKVVDQETLSEQHGEIIVKDAPNGSAMFTISCFTNALVNIDEEAGETDLVFERTTSVNISGGVVMYAAID